MRSTKALCVYPYDANISAEDPDAIIAYLRALPLK